jgi:bla regulator protein blaR1
LRIPVYKHARKGLKLMEKIAKVRPVVFLAILALLSVIPLLSQTAATQKPSFEVVSIKPTQPSSGFRIGGGAPRGDRVNLAGANLRMLLQQAYSKGTVGILAGQLQIIGGPNWTDTDRWDIDAKADCSSGTLTREQTQLMWQSMLEDRFQLKAHLETRDLPIYNLVVGKDGPKIKKSEDQTPPPITAAPRQPCAPAPADQQGQGPLGPPALPPPPAPGQPLNIANLPRGATVMMMSPSGMSMQASGVPIANLIGVLQQQSGRPIYDKTNLQGLYDIKLTFLPENNPFGPGGPGGTGPAISVPGGAAPNTNTADPVASVFTAVQEQLGLKLESSKGPVEVVVVDSVQKPTEN